MFNQSIRSIAIVGAVALVSTLFADTSSARLFGGRGGLFQRNRAGADCCCQVPTCCQQSGYGNIGYGNTGYDNAGYGNAGYGNTGYGNNQSYPGYSNQSGQLLNGNAYNQGNGNSQNSVQSSDQTGSNFNSSGYDQRGTFGQPQAGTSQNTSGILQTNPQVNTPGATTTNTSGQIDVNSGQLNSGVGVDGNLQSDQDNN